MGQDTTEIVITGRWIQMKRYDNKINVLFIIMQMGMGGSERLVHNLVQKLDRKLFNPSVAWFFGDKILKEFQELKVPLYHVPKVKRIDFSAMEKVGRIIRDNNIHIVNAHHFMSLIYSYYGCKINNKAKLIYTEHSEWEIERVSFKWRIIGRYLLNRTDAAVGVSSAIAKQIENKYKTADSKIITVQNGVDLNVFRNNGKKAKLREKMGIANDEKIIGIVANFKKVKNHIFLLRAFDELIKVINNVKLLLIGQGFEGDEENTESELRRFIVEKKLEKNIIFMGYRSDIPELLGIMDVFCLTSLKEGLPISLIEAMASGLPVVGTDVEGIRDVIIPDKNGILVEVGDVIGLRNALNTLIREEYLMKKYGEKSRNLARKIYSLDRCIKQYEDLFVATVESARVDAGR